MSGEMCCICRHSRKSAALCHEQRHRSSEYLTHFRCPPQPSRQIDIRLPNFLRPSETFADLAQAPDRHGRRPAPERGVMRILDDAAEDQIGSPEFFLVILGLPLETDLFLSFRTGEPVIIRGIEHIPLKAVPEVVVEVETLWIGTEEFRQSVSGFRSLLNRCRPMDMPPHKELRDASCERPGQPRGPCRSDPRPRDNGSHGPVERQESISRF